MTYTTQLSLDNIDELCKVLHQYLSFEHCIVLLRGDLASGKTTLVQSYMKYIGSPEMVTSPTFSLQTVYDEGKVFHYDLYRKSLNEFIALGLLQELEKTGLHFVEWGNERLENLLLDYGFDVIVITIEKYKEKRAYYIKSTF